jgi:hypothetical protein
MENNHAPALVNSPQDAIILCLLTAAAVDGSPRNAEIALIETLANTTPALATKSTEDYAQMMEIGLALISGPEGLDSVFILASAALSEPARATCYALVVEFICRNGAINPEELRFLELLGDNFSIDKLTRAAIEQATRIRLDPLSDPDL